MVQKPEIQYVHQFYVYGSEAKVLELKPQKKKNRSYLPKAAPDEKIKIAIDPFALCGIVVAVAMLVLLVVGSIQYLQVCQEYQQMMDYVVSVQNENVELRESYRSQIDLYRQALEGATGKSVKEAYLYLFDTGQFVTM